MTSVSIKINGISKFAKCFVLFMPQNTFGSVYYAAVLIGLITGLARPSVCAVRAFSEKTKSA